MVGHAALVLRLSPSTCLRDDKGGDVPLGTKKDLLVLAYLALASPAGVSRSRIAQDCWPGVIVERARASLRTSLHCLRIHLGEQLEADRESVRLSPGSVRVVTDPGGFMPEFTEPWVRVKRARLVLDHKPAPDIHPILPAVDYLAEKNPVSGLKLLQDA
ncbi:MAG: hypothetical protein MUC92_10445 [Fimbriimonadaceae bacterium]|jgi:hypothetical protein|nr:hypothetical protein [Fimbriimonadaceae bacterium]